MPIPTPTEPRIEPIDPSVATEEQTKALEPLGAAGDLHLFRTLAHNPDLLRAWLRFAGKLLQVSALPARDREVVILRVAGRCDSDYEWGQHVGIARAAGLTDDEILGLGPQITRDETWSGWDAALVRATDELVDDHCVGDETWQALSERYETGLLLELTMLVGHYAMLAGTLRSAGVQTEIPLPCVGEV